MGQFTSGRVEFEQEVAPCEMDVEMVVHGDGSWWRYCEAAATCWRIGEMSELSG